MVSLGINGTAICLNSDVITPLEFSALAPQVIALCDHAPPKFRTRRPLHVQGCSFQDEVFFCLFLKKMFLLQFFGIEELYSRACSHISMGFVG